MLKQLLQQLYFSMMPQRCVLCLQLCQDYALCTNCARQLPWIKHACQQCALPLPDTDSHCCGACLSLPPPQQRSIACFHYRSSLDLMIHAYKFNQQLSYAPIFAQCMAQRLSRESLDVDAIIPIPLHRLRWQQRGYNQSLLMAKALGRRLHIPVDQHSLRRIKHTPAQHGLKRRIRQSNLKRAFAADHCPRRIALLDDVMTTGATIAAASRALQHAGAEYIEVWLLARTDKT